MDPNILSIILGVAGNGFTSLITYLGHQTGKSLIGKEFLEKWELDKTALQPILHKAIKDVEEEMPWHPPAYTLLRGSQEEKLLLSQYSCDGRNVVVSFADAKLPARSLPSSEN